MPRKGLTEFGRALTDDPQLMARFVDIWRKPPAMGDSPMAVAPERTPIMINDIAWELGIGQSKAAITMKYWADEGWVRRANPRTEQAAYEPTEKLLERFPEGPQIVEDPPVRALPSGATVQGVTEQEARGWDEDPKVRKLEPRRRAPGIVNPREPFGLPPGSGDAA